MDWIKWTQWDKGEMLRCGIGPLQKMMDWMVELGKDAKKCLAMSEKNHAVYGRKILDEDDKVAEVRFYCDVYMDDEELNKMVADNPHDVFYVAHK